VGTSSALLFYGFPGFSFKKADLRDPTWMNLDGIDAIIHLAAIVGDPACAKDPELAQAVNWEGSLNLYNAALRSRSVKRFIFSSTCSNYGKSTKDEFLTEEAELNPVSLYAKLKVQFEQHLLNDDGREDLCVTPLRFSTVYGLSPRMRFDLTVNEFTRDAFIKKKLVIFGEQFWRPYCSTQDISNACLMVLNAEPKKIHREVFNVGSNEENYTKKMLAEIIKNYIPDLEIEYVSRDEDPRDYRVDFSKIKSVLGFTPKLTVSLGVGEILKGLEAGLFGDPFSKAYSNI
jgi:nucleoside-diphosphate-sugar epimerase